MAKIKYLLIALLLTGCSIEPRETAYDKFANHALTCANELKIETLKDKMKQLNLPKMDKTNRVKIAQYIAESEIFNCINRKFRNEEL